MKRSSTTSLQAIVKDPAFWVVAITMAAFFLRVWRLGSVPPGWRDDEMINSLVISQKALDGELALYYPDASGHEALYHLLNAAMLAFFGPGVAGIRLLSAILGTLTVPLTYLVANRLYGWKVGLFSAAALALSFWSLIYSRIGIRHISLPVFMLATFYFFLRGMGIGDTTTEETAGSTMGTSANTASPTKNFILAGLLMGLGFYTYFASRGVPVILLGIIGYVWLFHRPMLHRRYKDLLLMFGLALLMALPLLVTLYRQPETEARVAELAVPLVEAQAGNFRPLGEHLVRTFSMFHSDGDEEWLYNIPRRPVFGLIAALFFWSGVAIATWYALKPILRAALTFLRRTGAPASTPRYEVAGAFLLIWWLIGISPAFVSVPAASLGHTIVAQSAVYILVALPIFSLARLTHRANGPANLRTLARALPYIVGLLLLLSILSRDLPDYFQEWPSQGMTRFLYRAEIGELAQYLNDHPELTDFGVTSLLAGPWDKLALDIELQDKKNVRPRWYNPERVSLQQVNGEPAKSFSGYPLLPEVDATLYQPISGATAGAFVLSAIKPDSDPAGPPICFQNGLCLIEARYEAPAGPLDLTWEVSQPLTLPAVSLISNPPPPGVYAGPRLLVFSHLMGPEGQILASDDGLWIDAWTLQAGDRFRQHHLLAVPDDGLATVVSFGLYDPMTNERILTVDGQDHLSITINK